jgi:hypothetical protein
MQAIIYILFSSNYFRLKPKESLGLFLGEDIIKSKKNKIN